MYVDVTTAAAIDNVDVTHGNGGTFSPELCAADANANYPSNAWECYTGRDDNAFVLQKLIHIFGRL